MKCMQCGSPYHPATGHVWQRDAVLCGPCCRRFFAWVKQHVNRMWGGQRFYEHAATSIRAK